MKAISIFLLLITITPLPELQAQNQGVIQAKIVDNKTNQPIPFATVKVMKGKAITGGVISNTDGSFQIPSTYWNVVDSLVISCIGYSNQTVKRDQLTENGVNEIRLMGTSVVLKEIVVMPSHDEKLTAREIVFQAIQNIPENYPLLPFSYIAYYRDYQKEENEYVNLNEAIIKVFDKGFNTNDYDFTKIKLYQYRANKDFRTDSSTTIAYDSNSVSKNKFIPGTTVFPFGGNELSLLRIHDAIRNNKAMSYSFVDKFSLHFIKFHSFTLLGTVYLDDVPLYHISFQSLNNITGPEYAASGDIYIESGNYAIHKLSYSNFLKKNKAKSLLYSINVEYSRIGSLFYPNYISFNNSFLVKSDREFKVADIAFDNTTESFIVNFNRTPLRTSALNAKNYKFQFDKKAFKIKEIEMAGENDKEVRVKISNASDFKLSELWENQNVRSPKLSASFHDIRDLQGNEINKTVFRPVNQFREIFLLKLDANEKSIESDPFISKQNPLKKSVVDFSKQESSVYWMNTPLIKN